MSTQADAPTTEATASDEALDAAVTAASTGAGTSSPAPAPSPEPATPASGGSGEGATSVQDYVEDDSLDLDSADLPAQTKDEIKKLRREVKGVKDVARSWQQATEGWHEQDVELLRQAMAETRTRPEAIGEWMANQAKTILGDRFAEVVGISAATEPEPEVPKVGDPDGEGGTLTQEDVDRRVNEILAERDRAQQVREQVSNIEREADELGFGPTTDLYFALLSIAKTKTNGDLKAAAERLRADLGRSNDNTADSQPGAGSQPQPGAGHTPAATEGGTPAGTQRPRKPRSAAEERLDKVLGNRRGFNDVL